MYADNNIKIKKEGCNEFMLMNNKQSDAEQAIEKKCCYCESAFPIKDTNGYMCNKKGIVTYSFSCKKFTFDPLKLSPKLPAKALKFSPSDFEI